MSEILIGRHREKENLLKWAASPRSEFIAIYGRRRVGKTYLVKQTFNNNFAFYFSGSYGLSRKQQLLNFTLALRQYSGDETIAVPDNWIMAFYELDKLINKCRDSRKIIFLDELPWIDTPKSGFVAALENFWNSKASSRSDIKLIVCGSATSWIINKIIRNKGGLHNRVTHTILLNPFKLGECEEYFKAFGFNYSRMQIAECYMTMGGIPYYFSLMDSEESLPQNIDRLFFADEAPLRNEFDDLYRALYKNYESHIKVIVALAEKGIGLTRGEIVKMTKLENNGELGNMLDELELCGFIRSYLPFENNAYRRTGGNKKSRETLYQLIDFYSLFYLRFRDIPRYDDNRFWSRMSNSPQINVWRGLTFEMLCLHHIDKVKQSLGIADVSTRSCSWRGEYEGHKAQIDLLIDRMDSTINICEMKYSHHQFAIDKIYATKLEQKKETFSMATHTDKNLLLTMITTKGIEVNKYSYLAQRQVTLDQMF